jgi:rSAM/selenodomain-associated transferase 2
MNGLEKAILGKGAWGRRPLTIPLPQPLKLLGQGWGGGSIPPSPAPVSGGWVGGLGGGIVTGPPALPPTPLISIIIPALNEARVLGETLAALPPDPEVEVLVVDGGSTDGTLEVAAGFPQVKCLAAPCGRGLQMNAGARLAEGSLFTFLHADTRLGLAHLNVLRQAAQDPRFQAGAFELGFWPSLPALDFIAREANRRSRLLHLPYGDQALTLRRGLFFHLGGYAHRSQEDLDLVIRLRRLTRLQILTPPVITSARNWLEQGYFRTTRRHWLALARHLAERALTHRWPGQGEVVEKD